MSADNLPPGTNVNVVVTPTSPIIGGGEPKTVTGTVVDGTPADPGRVYVNVDGRDNDIPADKVTPA
jgi:hypothetical protein